MNEENTGLPNTGLTPPKDEQVVQTQITPTPPTEENKSTTPEPTQTDPAPTIEPTQTQKEPEQTKPVKKVKVETRMTPDIK